MPVRLAVVGVGGIAGHHLGNLRAIGADVEFAGFCDLIPERAANAVREYGGIATTDFRELYDAGADAAFICTPPTQHGEIEFEAARRGYHIFVEKPVATDMGLAREISAAITEAGVASAVGYKYRWDTFVREGKKALEGASVGMVIGWFWSTMVGGPWWRYLDLSGGQMTEQCTHIIDLARYLVGEIVEVSGYTSTCGKYEPASTVPDGYVLQCVFENGACGSITASCMTARGVGSGIRVFAEGLGLHIEAPRAVWTDSEGEHVAEGGTDGYQGELVAFLNACRGDRSDLASDYADAVKSLAVSVAMMKSAEQGGKPIDPHSL